jgi:hypothetical protein
MRRENSAGDVEGLAGKSQIDLGLKTNPLTSNVFCFFNEFLAAN